MNIEKLRRRLFNCLPQALNLNQHNKYFLMDNSYERSSTVGFRCAADAPAVEGSCCELCAVVLSCCQMLMYVSTKANANTNANADINFHVNVNTTLYSRNNCCQLQTVVVKSAVREAGLHTWLR